MWCDMEKGTSTHPKYGSPIQRAAYDKSVVPSYATLCTGDSYSGRLIQLWMSACTKRDTSTDNNKSSSNNFIIVKGVE